MDWVAIALPLLRGLELVPVASSFGFALFRVVVAPAALMSASASAAAQADHRLLAGLRVSLVLAIVLGLLWLPVEAVGMAGGHTLAAAATATPVVLFRTHFGTMLLLRFGVLVLALALATARASSVRAGVIVATGVALGSQAGMGHAAAATDLALPIAEVLHLLAAGSWLGGLLPLLLLLRRASPDAAAIAARRFSRLGIGAVLVLLCTAVVESGELIGGITGLVGTQYGRTALAKLALFAVLLCLAGINRFEFTPHLDGPAADVYANRLGRSIIAEMTLGFAVVLLAGYLATEVPALHEMPLWPFAVRPEWRAFPATGAAREVVIATAAAGSLAIIGFSWWRFRWRGGIASGVLLCAVAATQITLEAVPKLVRGTGTFLATVPNADLLVVNGDEIPGYMAKMTMPYKVASPALLEHLEPGERIEFDIDPSTAVVVAVRPIPN